MELQNYYYWFKSALSPETCDKILELGKSKMAHLESIGASTEAVTFGDNQKGAKPNAAPQNEEPAYNIDSSNDVYIRDSNIVWLEDQWLYDTVYPFLQEANTKAGWNWQYDYSEALQFTKYQNDQFYGWHADGNSDVHGAYKRYIHGITKAPLKPDGNIPSGFTTYNRFIGKVRKLSMTINLCDENEYEGGDLKFDFGLHKSKGDRFHLCEEIRPRGSIIIFPSFVQHCVTPVTKGTRYSLVMWTLGEPWK
jgi:PKHD-type hydroxylase